MRELSEVTPNSAWLSVLQIDDEGAQLSGVADRSAPLLSVLNDTRSLQEASFLASLRKTDEGEQFRIGAKRAETAAGEQPSLTAEELAAEAAAEVDAAEAASKDASAQAPLAATEAVESAVSGGEMEEAAEEAPVKEAKP